MRVVINMLRKSAIPKSLEHLLIMLVFDAEIGVPGVKCIGGSLLSRDAKDARRGDACSWSVQCVSELFPLGGLTVLQEIADCS